MRRRRPLGRWEDAYLDGICGLVLLAAMVFLLWSIAGCAYQRHLEQHQRTQETTKAKWQETAAAATATQSAFTGQAVRAKKKAVRHLRTDGTPWKEEIELDDSTLTFLATSAATASFTASAAGEIDRSKKGTSDKLSGIKAGTGWSRWWLLLLLLIPAGLALWRWKLEPFRRVWHLVKQR